MDKQNRIRKTAFSVLRKHRIINPSLDDLVQIAKELGFDVIDYSKSSSDSSAEVLIRELGLESFAKSGKSFLYQNNKIKLILDDSQMSFQDENDEYGLSYSAAFKGCSEQSEASAKTITFLINKVKADDIPVILHIELSNKNIANTISKETGTKVLEFNSAHNISQKDFDEGITYIDIMKKNIEVLREALN